MLEILFELVFELVAEIVLTVFFELGFRVLVEPFRISKDHDRAFAFFGYLLLGVIAGWLSLLMFPEHLIKTPYLRMANLIITPILLGFVFFWLGKNRERRERAPLKLDRFSYGFTFALVMAVFRLAFCK